MNKRVGDLFVGDKKVSVIVVTHNLFYKPRWMRSIRMHADFLVLFNIACGMSQVYTLSRQVSPGNRLTVHTLHQLSKTQQEPMYGYLLVDNREETPKQYRLWTNILKWVSANATKYYKLGYPSTATEYTARKEKIVRYAPVN